MAKCNQLTSLLFKELMRLGEAGHDKCKWFDKMNIKCYAHRNTPNGRDRRNIS